jgi:hypothetical protein
VGAGQVAGIGEPYPDVQFHPLHSPAGGIPGIINDRSTGYARNVISL